MLDSGEHVIGAAGEVHLGTCIKDLQERFAKVELRVSRWVGCGLEGVTLAIVRGRGRARRVELRPT